MELNKFRQLLQKKSIDIYILNRTDEHQSEYLCQCDQRLAFLTGFTGSNGLALISQKQAFVWTDSRYYVQIKKQLKEGWEMKQIESGQESWYQFIINNYPQKTKLGFDSRLLPSQTIHTKKFFLSKGYELDYMDYNLIDEIWQNKPKPSSTDIYVHENWAGSPAKEKFQWVRKFITEKSANGCLFTDLSEICWMLNVRSSEIPYNPFMKSIFLLNPQGQISILYLPETHQCLNEISNQLKQHFENLKVIIKSYPFLPLPQKLLYQKSTLNFFIFNNLIDPIQWDGIGLYRAVRNQKQMNGFRQCHIQDGVAMASFWGWRSTLQSIGQYQAAMQLNNRRYKLPLNKGLSFDTISAGGPNAALPHYTPSSKEDFIVTKDMVHLIDSGGQYLNGTTDVTRTFHFGNPTQQEKDAYTRVLLGNLDIQRMVWPKNHGLRGRDFDLLARRRLWQVKLDYGHGTGHGVGYFQGVHEDPVGIHQYNQVVYKPGMVVSNQPGYYKEGGFGIRIQNLILVIQIGDSYGFENLTLCPYDINLMKLSLLSREDIIFINKYHERCWNILSPLLQNDELALKWLKKTTESIPIPEE